MSEEITIVERGIATFRDGNFEGAISILEEASRAYPESYEAFVYLAAAYAQQGRHNLSIGAFKRASEINPTSPLSLIHI